MLFRSGDVCDACPLNAGSAECGGAVETDRDQDGVLDADDNCPAQANPGQENLDGDGLGDACDPCPAVALAAGGACPTTIYAVRQGRVTEKVAISNAYVPAVAPIRTEMTISQHGARMSCTGHRRIDRHRMKASRRC